MDIIFSENSTIVNSASAINPAYGHHYNTLFVKGATMQKSYQCLLQQINQLPSNDAPPDARDIYLPTPYEMVEEQIKQSIISQQDNTKCKEEYREEYCNAMAHIDPNKKLMSSDEIASAHKSDLCSFRYN